MAGEIERQVLLQQVHRAQLVGLPRLGELLERGIGAGDVGQMVLVVVQFHDLAGDMRFQRTVVVRQIGKDVVGHGSPHGSLSHKPCCHSFAGTTLLQLTASDQEGAPASHAR
jgi:hypothetical protein